VSSDSPCGENLEYDAAYLEMMRGAAGKPAQVMGGQTIPAEEPDWRTVRDQCLELFGRTKDLRVAITLAQALIRTSGLGGFAEGLALVRGLIERHWEGVHPRLDPDDKNDPTFRVNALAGLASRESTVAALRLLPLAHSRRVGRYGIRDFEIANGTLPKPEGAEAVADMTMIEAAFLDTDSAELAATGAAAKEAFDQLAGLDGSLNTAVGSASSADFSLLKSTLKSMNSLLQQQLARRGMGSGDAAAFADDGGGSSMGGRPAMSGPIQTREDVIRSLDQVCDWYSKYEPSSPVPILLQRAKRLVNKNFLEAIQDLTPSGVTEIQTIAGVDLSS
jgi:type VI secretion system protein ImpA